MREILLSFQKVLHSCLWRDYLELHVKSPAFFTKDWLITTQKSIFIPHATCHSLEKAPWHTSHHLSVAVSRTHSHNFQPTAKKSAWSQLLTDQNSSSLQFHCERSVFSSSWLPPKCQVIKQKQLESKPLEGFSSLLRRMTLNFASWSGGWAEFFHRNTACLLRKINNFICHMLTIKISETPESDSTQPLNNHRQTNWEWKENTYDFKPQRLFSHLRCPSRGFTVGHPSYPTSPQRLGCSIQFNYWKWWSQSLWALSACCRKTPSIGGRRLLNP